MSQQELLKRVIEVLERIGVEYMLTGSTVSSLQGEPRATHDIDLVVDFPAAAADALVASFPPPDYYLSKESMLEAIQRRSMFNLLSMSEGEKVDFWILTDEPFDRSRFARRYEEKVAGVTFKVSAPEDTILAKLRWAKMAGGSAKQVTDALRVYELQRGKLDVAYLDRWASQLAVEALWHQLKASAESVE